MRNLAASLHKTSLCQFERQLEFAGITFIRGYSCVGINSVAAMGENKISAILRRKFCQGEPRTGEELFLLEQ